MKRFGLIVQAASLPAICAILVALLGPTSLCAQDGYAVQNISFGGNSTIPASSLRLLMRTKSVGGIAKLFGKRGPDYDEEVMVQDVERIKAFYQREGFLYVAVGPVHRETDEQDRAVTLRIPITEGPPIMIRQVTHTLAPSTSLPDSLFRKVLHGVERDLTLRPNERFRDSSVTLDQTLLLRELANIGYPYAKAEPELSVSQADTAVDVNWQIQSGPRCVFGETRILGSSEVPAPVIMRQVACREGDLFRLASVEQTQQQVYGLGVFQVATATPAFGADSVTVIPVEAFVKDAKRFSTKLGIGYGTEDRFRVMSETRLLGFLGGARRLELYLKHSYLEPYHIAVTLTQPGYPTPRTTLTLSPFLRRQREPAYTVNRTGISLGAAHQFSPALGGSILYSLEQIDVAEAALAETADSVDLPDLYNKSQLIVSSSFDNSRPLFNPRRGFYNVNSISFSGLGFGSEARFIKVLADLRRYQPLASLVLAMRIKVGGIRAIGSESFVPVEELLYSGGSSSVRGWARYELGPQTDGEPIGGQSLLEGSAEVRYPVYGIFSGVVFADVGNVWTGSFFYNLSDIRYSAGVGIRISTPIGPIRLDVARPVADEDDKVQFHISIGQAF